MDTPPATTQKFLRRRVPLCPNCEFDLRMHLKDDGAVCPECGKRWRRSELRGADMSARERFAWCAFVWIIYIVLFMPVCFVIAGIVRGILDGLGAMALVFAGVASFVMWGLCCISAWWLMLLMEMRRKPRTGRQFRNAMVIPFIMACTGSLLLVWIMMEIDRL